MKLNQIKKTPFLRKSLALLAALKYGFPAKDLKIIGITGTCGKTTTSFMVKNILEAAGLKTGLIGTAGYYLGDGEVILPKAKTPATTPDPFVLHRLLKKMKEKNIKAVVMEVSSFGLMYQRVYGLNFSSAVLTNLSFNHHISLHGNMEKYVTEKLKLFKSLSSSAIAVLPKESEYYPLFKKNTKAKNISFGFDDSSDLWAEIKQINKSSTQSVIHFKGNVFSLVLPLSGAFNVANALSAIGAVDFFSFDTEITKKGLESLKSIPGRLEILKDNDPFTVIVDKANNPSAFDAVIEFIKQWQPKKKIAVYGNFGEAPLEERQKLAEIATNFFDLTIITEDDPQYESPEKGINDFLDYVKTAKVPSSKYKAVLRRKEAIKEAIKQAQAGDLIAVLGRGNEQIMDYGKKTVFFDDREVAREVLKEQGYL